MNLVPLVPGVFEAPLNVWFPSPAILGAFFSIRYFKPYFGMMIAIEQCGKLNKKP
jgi:hypothetical protein